MEVSVTKEIVFSYLSGSCSAFQKRLIEKWLRDDSNRELFFAWLCEWERSNIQYEVDVTEGLQRHREWVNRFRHSGERSYLSEKNNAPRSSWKRIAVAAGLVLAVATAALFFKGKLLNKDYRTAFGEIKKITLEDGSKVVLNANSVLTVPRFLRFYDSRTVSLKGEASFEVSKSPKRRKFLVKTGDDTEIEVLGTVFNVYNRGEQKRIALSEGKVQLNYRNKDSIRETITMKPGELATICKSGIVKLKKAEDVLQHSAWKYHRFVFQDLTFRQIGHRLEEVFGARLVFADSSLASQLISGTFTALYPEEVLEILKDGGDFEYSKEGEDFYIRNLASPDTRLSE